MKKTLMILIALAMVFSMAGVVSAGETDITYQVEDGYEVHFPPSGTMNLEKVDEEKGYIDVINEYTVGVLNAQIPVGQVLKITLDSENDFNVIATSGNTVSKVEYRAGIPDESGEYSDIPTSGEILRIGIGDDYTTTMKFYTTEEWIREGAKISTIHRDELTFNYEFIKVPDVWDGSVDTSWYNEADTEFTLTTAEQFAGFAKLVDEGNTFERKTIKLGVDMDLEAYDENGNRINFNPIGHSQNGKSFNGIFDGQGHTIKNLYEQSNLDSNNGGWQYEGEYYSLFAYTNGATIRNLKIEDAYISSGRNEAACVVGNAVGTTFSNIDIINATLIAYNNSAGGVAAECYGECSFVDITVDEDTVIGPLWGTYDVRLGGVVGMVKASDKVSFKDITVACQLDAINDVASNYQYWLYRYSGMLIGQVDAANGVADPTGYVTCENVKVIYDDWVNYHYCEDADLGAGSYNGPGEYKYARVEAGTGTDGIDLSTCNHNEDESHNVLIVFDQLFGGGQGVSGLKTYDGVTVVYNNK